MKARLILSGILLICLMATNLGIAIAKAPSSNLNPISTQSTTTTNSIGAMPYSVTPIDVQAGKDIGDYASIAFDPGTGIPYISYYDAATQTLKLASPGSGTNCGPNNTWWCRTVDSDVTSKIGRYSSIAIYRNKQTLSWSLGIAYINDNNNGLRFAEWRCTFVTCSWTYTDIFKANAVSMSAPSLKYGSDGVPQIAFHASILGISSLFYTTRVGSGGNCPDPAWECSQLTTGGIYNSLAITSTNEPVIAYYDDSKKQLMFATQLNTSQGFTKNCGPGPNYNTWYCYNIEGFDDVGLFPSMVIKGTVPYIAYYDKTSGKLKLAHWVGKDGSGNCALSGQTTAFEWQCTDMFDVGVGVTINMGISLALDSDQNLVIAYMDAHDDQGPSGLVIARPNAAYDIVAGNCGPSISLIPGHPIYQWTCKTLDGGGQYADEAEYASVAISPTGLAYAAYTEWDSYNNVHSLKLAMQQMPVFIPVMMK